MTNSWTSGLKTGYIALVLFMMFCRTNVRAQSKLEGGPFLGVSYYNGDLNPQRQFYNIHPAFGGLLRYVFNDRIAAKSTLTLGDLSGSYPQKNILYPTTTSGGSSYFFRRTVADLSGQIEINFFSYDHAFRKAQTTFTPYLSGGLATTLYRRYQEDGGNRSEKPHFILSLPVGIGVKWKPTDWMRFGAEWTFRKTFVDDLDKLGSGAVDPADPFNFNESSGTHNNDWYSFAGVYVTFTLLKQRSRCEGGY